MRPSLLYDIKNEVILHYGDEANEKKHLAETDNTIFYVDNIFMKLNDIHLKIKKDENDVHDQILLNGVEIMLRDLNDSYAQVSKSDKQNGFYHYLFIVPTRWDPAIREDLLRPLFIRTGLIHQEDHPYRLLFYSQLDLDFCYLQYLNDDLPTYRMNTKIGNGRHYILYKLNFSDTHLFVTLDLFSAHYSPFVMSKVKYVPKSLVSRYLTFPLTYDIQESSIRTSIIDPLSITDKRSDIEWEQYSRDGLPDTTDGSVLNNESVVTDQSIDHDGLMGTDESIKTNNEFMEMEDDSGLLSSILKSLLDETKTLTNYTGSATYAAIVISNISRHDERDYGLLNYLSQWIKNQGQDMFRIKLATFGDEGELNYEVSPLETFIGGDVLIREHVKMSNTRRPPLILDENCNHNKDASASLFKDSRPNCIINIGIWKEFVFFFL